MGTVEKLKLLVYLGTLEDHKVTILRVFNFLFENS